MALNPWHLHQLANSKVPLNSQCLTLVREHAWQDTDRAGRHEIRQAIESAEQLVFRYARFWPSPRFREVTLAAPQCARGWPVLVLPEGDIRALGPATDSGTSNVALTYSDDDDDGLSETATATATVSSGTTADQIVCRFLAADCVPVAQQEVRPRSVSVSGTTATITFDTWTLVRPKRYQGVAAGQLDPGDTSASGVFAQQVQVLRRRADPTGTTTDTAMAVLTWETQPWPFWACCNGSSSDPAATATALARAVIRDARAGIIAFGEATYNSTAGTWSAACDFSHCRPPDRIVIRYQAGKPLSGIEMAPEWATTVARLAAAELARPICACASANKELYEWQKDLSQTGATDDLYAAPGDITNPLGHRRGHVYAWRQLQREQRVTGIFAG